MREARVDALMSAYSGQVPGAAVVVSRDGVVVFHKGYGLADVEAGKPVTPATNFRLASVTKQFTATAIEILEERGKLSYDDPIVRWLPSLPACAKAITIRQLLTHTAGLLDYEDLIPKTRTEQVHDDDVLRMIDATDHTLFPPGSRYLYSNTGYVLLGLIAERASGQPFGAFMKAEVFDPLGMSGTAVMEPGIVIGHRAYGEALVDGHWARHDQSVTSATLGDGGIYSSVDDLARWDEALRRATLVRPATLRLAFSPLVATDEPAVHYGFGWRVGTHRGQPATWHKGETAGFTNAILRLPHVTVVVLTNRDNGDPLALARDIADLGWE